MALIKVSVTNLNGDTDTIAVQDGTTVGELFTELLGISEDTPFLLNGSEGYTLDYELEPNDMVVVRPKKNTNG